MSKVEKLNPAPDEPVLQSLVLFLACVGPFEDAERQLTVHATARFGV